jgi:hypothetical protein
MESVGEGDHSQSAKIDRLLSMRYRHSAVCTQSPDGKCKSVERPHKLPTER